jgi:hypothetical protein
MPKTQRLIIACLALALGVFIGILLSNFLAVPTVTAPAGSNAVTAPASSAAVLEAVKAKLTEKNITVTGLTPFLLVEQFPNVKEEDFNGSEAVIGKYVFNGSVLVYEGQIEDTTSVADLTDQGFATFVSNYLARTKVTGGPENVVTSMLGTIATPDPEESVETPEDEFVACTLDAKVCPDGSYVGRTAPDCAFAACPGEVADGAETEPVSITCTAEQREAEACIEIYAPVCAAEQVECVTTPCNPVPKTYPNSCFACASDRVISYTEGMCEGDAPVQ